MTPEEFRRNGHKVVDWVADYLSDVDKYPVKSRVEPGWVRSQLPATAPEAGENFDAIIADLDRVILPGLMHWQSPGFFGYFPANNSGPSILGELVSAGLGVQGMMWLTSPACTELESHVLDWLVELLGLPDGFRSEGAGGGVIQDSASSAVLCALLAARERATNGQSNRSGIDAPLVVYATDQAHSSIDKAVRIAGIGSVNLRRIRTNADLSMSAPALAEAIRADLAVGKAPCFVAATVGTTATNAVDPVAAIAEICEPYGVWLHVDAAMLGSATICPEFRHLISGLSGADSYCFNPHKWLLTNFDCSCFFVRNRASLIAALSILPEYLRNAASESGAVIDYRDWQIPLGRRFRALKLWFVLRSYGAAELRAMVRRHVKSAQWFAGMVAASTEFELVTTTPLNLVCFRHIGGNVASEYVMNAVNDSGKAFLTHARINDSVLLRLSVGQEHTEPTHLETTWQLLREACASV
ncbi:pyridoxal-dependent decarboxylase [Nocardia abscessus]|uniref:pyridoxal-dependent decarboxylase n=1 Tax=Nocardia abscessus TaxID=120957 RepID=UPI002457D5B1|nr:pyridoxal-dependent decarboxylase [Nocardia abscessus]